MRQRQMFFLATAFAALTAPPVYALDTVRTVKGTNVNGAIQQITAREVTIKPASGNVTQIAASDIESIKFGGEPPQLNVARTAALGGRYDEALRNLDKLAGEAKAGDREEVQQDVAYYRAYCAAKLALAGAGDAVAAGKQLREFVQKNANSYHYLVANELLGDLLTALDKYDAASQYYAAVEKLAASDAVKMRAKNAQARALESQGKWAEADIIYDGALALADDDKSPPVVEQRQLASLGKAMCLAGGDKPDEGVKLIEAVIAEANPDQVEVYARAYNALGACQRKAGRNKEALLAYLHVDLLFPAPPLAHAEALKNLSELWPAVGNQARGSEALDALKTRYGNTRWGKS